MREERRHRHEAPDDHDAGNPEARANAGEDQVARNLEEAIAEKEETGADTVGRVVQSEVPLQFGGRKPDVHAVDVGDDVADERERDEAAGDARDYRAARVGGQFGHLGDRATVSRFWFTLPLQFVITCASRRAGAPEPGAASQFCQERP